MKLARAQGSPSRAIFKLEQIDDMASNYIKRKQDKQSSIKGIIRPGTTVLDLGAAPGGWSKYVAKRLQANGVLIAVDLLALDGGTVTSIESDHYAPSFHVIQGDFTTDRVKEEIIDLIVNHENQSNQRGVECVISDMAANFTGDQLTDALRTMNLCEDALMLAAGPSCFDERYIAGSAEAEDGLLNRGGTFLTKFFACGTQNEKDLMDATKRHFELSTVLKPNASRKESAELYLFATGYKGGKQI